MCRLCGGGMEIIMRKEKVKNPRLGKAGGQAVLEGVMMKSGENVALAVRKEDGTIALETSKQIPIKKKYKILGVPVIRGAVSFVETLILSMKTLTRSGELLGIDETDEESAFDRWLKKHFGKSAYNVIMGVGIVLGVAIAIGLFVILPLYITTAIDKALGGIGWFKNLIAGFIKIAIFIAYLWGVSFMKDIRRTFEYHGAEHKTIACYESGLELTPANAKTCTRFHPRCGTSFIFITLILSILVFSVISWDMNKLAIAGLRVVLLPIVVGLSYECIMIAGKHPNTFTRILSAPGLLMQRITTREPDESQLEVAIAAFKAAIPDEFPKEETEAVKAEQASDDPQANVQMNATDSGNTGTTDGTAKDKTNDA